MPLINPTVISCAILDDEPLARQLLESYVNRTAFLKLIGSFSNAVEAMGAIRAAKPRLLFVDIQMPDLNGVEFAKLLLPTTRVIFTTAFSQYAIDGYKVNAIDYLLKPIAYPDFVLAAQKALEWVNQTAFQEFPGVATTDTSNLLFVKSDRCMRVIHINKIVYLEGLKDYVKIVTDDSPKPIYAFVTMKTLLTYLPKETFLRVHRSFTVNMMKVTGYERGSIVIGDLKVSVSGSFKARIVDFVDQHTVRVASE